MKINIDINVIIDIPSFSCTTILYGSIHKRSRE